MILCHQGKYPKAERESVKLFDDNKNIDEVFVAYTDWKNENTQSFFH